MDENNEPFDAEEQAAYVAMLQKQASEDKKRIHELETLVKAAPFDAMRDICIYIEVMAPRQTHIDIHARAEEIKQWLEPLSRERIRMMMMPRQ